ncbi:MAG: TonB-dependent receptor, partial [Gemmatimonadota bacterium]|nr:TonB-dependent receptor [Gemmatimonadota bacterium]
MFRNGLVLVRAVSLAVLAVVALASPRIVLAQATASITGTLRGQGGDPVSGVRVAFEPGGIVVETDARGGFRLSVPAATAGVLQFAAVGFSPEERAVAPLAPGEVRQIAATLRPLHLLPPIAVDAARTRPLLETQGAATGGSIEAAEVAALPTDARNPIALLYNVPGVAQATAYFGDAPTLSLNGANSLYTVYTLDGLDDNEGFLGGPRVDLPLSAVRRMDAWVNSYSALYGRSSNGGVDRQTIRGSNARTGSVFVYWRPGRPIDGQNQVPFGEVAEAVARRQEGFQRIQVGGSVAGPLVRDRTVYAMAAEYTAEQEDRIGSTALTPFLGTEDRRTVKLFGRLDHAWTPSQATTLRFALSSLSRAGEGNGVITPEADVTTRRVGSLTALSHRSSFGEGRGSNTASLQVGTFRWFFPPTVSDFSRPQVTVISPARAVQAVVGSSNFVFDERETQLQLRNVVEVSTRRHTLRAGGEVITSQFALAAAGTNPNGAYVVFNDGNIPVP